jgi:hypothetical protein
LLGKEALNGRSTYHIAFWPEGQKRDRMEGRGFYR